MSRPGDPNADLFHYQGRIFNRHCFRSFVHAGEVVPFGYKPDTVMSLSSLSSGNIVVHLLSSSNENPVSAKGDGVRRVRRH